MASRKILNYFIANVRDEVKSISRREEGECRREKKSSTPSSLLHSPF
jgi:hypothetical protein